MNLDSSHAKLALSIAKRLKAAGHEAYFAGGCVRDDLMHKTPQDFDIATTATPDQVEKLFPKTVPVGKQFGVILVLEEGRPFEVATFRREGGYVDGRHPTKVDFTVPEEDAKRRDFTVNGLFYDPAQAKVLDFVGGVQDIEKKIVRAIGRPEERFSEDKLRLLRAVRFASSLGFEIEKETWASVRANASRITQVSPERIRDEIVKIFTRPGAGRGFLLLSESGLMKEILPEVEAMKGVPQPPEFHPEGDVFIHTQLLMEGLESPSPVLAMAALLHDVGKPPTLIYKEGKVKFYEHADVGAKMADGILRRLRFSNDEIRDIQECIAKHMQFGDVKKMRSGKLKRFVARPTFGEELELHKIDCNASHRNLENYHFLKEKMEEYRHEELKPKPILNGHDLMALGMKAGAAMKPFLEEAYELQLEGELKERDGALAWARKKIASMKQEFGR